MRGMTREPRIVTGSALLLGLLTLLVSCATTAQPSAQAPASTDATAPRATKTLTIGLSSTVASLGSLASPSGAGGWLPMTEIYTDALVTSDEHSRQPVGRLASRVPSLDDGSITVLPDGRMRVEYHLRPGITWQDGVPFTAQDLVFSTKLDGDSGLPTINTQATHLMDSAEAPDDSTFVINFKGPYYRGGQLGPQLLWPLPQHLLGEPYSKYLDTKNPDDMINLPFWTSGYVSTSPFKLTSFEEGEGLTFQAYDAYYLGRPHIDTVRIRFFEDPDTLYANLLSGTVDMFAAYALSQDQSFSMRDQWATTHDGTVYLLPGSIWFVSPQLRPSLQIEAAVLDPRVRAAFYMALDRDTLADELLNGKRDQAAYSLLPTTHPLYDVTKDALRQFAYDPNRAKAQLAELGWTTGADGALHNTTDGRVFNTGIWTTQGMDRDEAAIADYWRKLGIQVDEYVVPRSRARDEQYRASYPGWEYSTASPGDGVLDRVETGAAGNRGGYEDSHSQALLDAYRASLSPQDQRQAMQAISDYFVQQLPFLPIYFNVFPIGIRTRVTNVSVEGASSG